MEECYFKCSRRMKPYKASHLLVYSSTLSIHNPSALTGEKNKYELVMKKNL